MFKFTTTSIINSDKYLNGHARWTATDDKFAAFHNSVVIKKDDIVKAFKRKASDGVNALNTITLADAKYTKTNVDGTTTPDTAPVAGDLMRVKIYVRLAMSDQDSYYANDLVFKGKPFIFEFVYGDSQKKVLKIANEIAVMENAQLTFKADGNDATSATDDAAAVITVEGKKPTQQFAKMEVEVWDSNVKTTYPGQVGAFVPCAADAVVATNLPKEPFGSYAYLMKDLTLPTYENIRWAGEKVDERPIPGATYNQYTVYICKNRGIMGGDAVGEEVKSVTCHIFWINTAIDVDGTGAGAKLAAVAGDKMKEYNAADAVTTTTSTPTVGD
jgi:hypothetical protein